MLSSSFAGIGRSLLATCVAGFLVLAGGCNETEQAAAPAAQVTAPPVQRLPTIRPDGVEAVAPQPAAPQPATPGHPAAAPTVAAVPVSAPALPLPNIPPDAQFTIFCFAVNGGNHVQDAIAMKDSLVRKTGRSDWYLIHGRDESNLYFGFYKAVQRGDKNVAEVNRAQNDLREVQELRDKYGNKPFEHSSAFVPLEAPDPTSPPEWNLFNIDKSMNPKDPRRGYWSLQIMAFRANPKRKEAAVEAVRDLRARGVEAYYYHGESISSVCIGHWPADALKAQNRTTAHPDAPMADPNTNLAVSTVDFGEEWHPKDIQGHKTVAAVAKQEIMDPSLQQMMQKFPHHAVNYEEGKQLANGKIVYNSSFLVEIPRAKGNGLYDSVDPNAPPPTQRRGIGDPNGPTMTGTSGGVLRPGDNPSVRAVR